MKLRRVSPTYSVKTIISTSSKKTLLETYFNTIIDVFVATASARKAILSSPRALYSRLQKMLSYMSARVSIIAINRLKHTTPSDDNRVKKGEMLVVVLSLTRERHVCK